MTNFEKSGDEQGPPPNTPPAGSYPQGQGGSYPQGQGGGYSQGQGGYPQGPPSGYPQGPPSGYPQGPPSGYPQGPPSGYPQGPPSGYQQGPPPGYPPAGYGPNMPAPPYYPPPGGEGFPMLPPGVEPASHGRRIGAYFLAIPLLIITLVIGYLIWGLVLWGKGTSPALRLLGMRCVDSTTGQPAGFGKMALRNIVGGIVQTILSLITALVSFILFLTTAKRQTLPDLIGSTVVVYDPNKVLDAQR